MKHTIFAFLLILLPCVLYAQYYGEHDTNTCSGQVRCTSCFGTGYYYGYRCMSCGGSGVIPCPMCASSRIVSRIVQQQKAARWNNALYCLQDGISKLMGESFDEAMEYFERSAELGNAQAYMYIGEMYEFGFGVEGNKTTAKRCYERGAAKGDFGCKNRLQRISQYGYFEPTVQNRKAYIQYMRSCSTWAAVSAKQMNDRIWGNSSSSDSNRGGSISGSCSRCRGTGVDPSPNSGGSLHNWVAYYNPNGTKCRYCGRYTAHYHDRCAECNTPRY